jgi:DNA polymerase III epsilon subunit-like protein
MESFPGELFYKPQTLSAEKSAGAYLFFDTETTGLPGDWNAPVSDLNNWPRLVQIAWIFYKDGAKVNSGDYIIRPEGFTIPKETADIHGISTERALKEGVALLMVLKEFENLVRDADFLVAHNMSFDEKIMGAEYLRSNMSDAIAGKNKICTKDETVNFCAIPSAHGFSNYKWPKLSELHAKLFGADFEDCHNAVADINATAKCFWELKKRGIL